MEACGVAETEMLDGNGAVGNAGKVSESIDIVPEVIPSTPWNRRSGFPQRLPAAASRSLSKCPGFDSPNPPDAVRLVREHVDVMVREFCGTQARAAEFGI